jgi:hypothetical protein
VRAIFDGVQTEVLKFLFDFIVAFDVFEHSGTCNGTTAPKPTGPPFDSMNWVIGKCSPGRRAKQPVFRFVRDALVLRARLPLLEELFLDRICVDLEKAGTASCVE